MASLPSIVKLLRPHQWMKNLFVFIPMFFSGNLMNFGMWEACLFTFVGFSLVASSVYCLNDIKDLEADRRHPEKSLRPIASGEVSVGLATLIMVVLFFCGISVAWFFLPEVHSVAYVLILYAILNTAYCYKLKQIAIVDVFIVATGFVLRVLAGGFACDIWVSPWLICLSFLLALFLAFAKRRDDVILLETRGIRARENVTCYNTRFLDLALVIIAAITMMSYIMYTVSPEVEARFGCEYVYITALFVLAGILRYLQVTVVNQQSGSPTKVLMKDRFIQLTIVCWLLTFVVIIYK